MKTIKEYIAREPAPIQRSLKSMHAIVRKAAPKAMEKLAWGMPTLWQEGNLIHFAAFKNHMSLFPGSDAVAHFKKDLVKFETTKAGIHFSYGEKIPVGLVTKIVKFRVKENLAAAAAKVAAKAARKK